MIAIIILNLSMITVVMIAIMIIKVIADVVVVVVGAQRGLCWMLKDKLQ